MTSGSELEHTDWCTSQRKEGRGSSYKREQKREIREIVRTTTEL